jgi:aminoglycoside phosphotransferase (APT) family kinase protein
VRRLRNAWASAVHAVDVIDGDAMQRLALRRWVRPDLPPDDGIVENEVAALGVLAASELGVPVPELVGADTTGDGCGAPALLMTRLAGRDTLTPRDLDEFVVALASTLHAVHAVTLPPNALSPYHPWIASVTVPPPWTSQHALWERAMQIAHAPLPACEPIFLHRDFHPGNVLWRRGRVSGLVDWTHACRGAAAADVAHCRMNLAVLFGVDVADVFAERYGPVDDLAVYDVAALVGAAADGPPEVWRWHDAGRTDITGAQLTGAHEELLARAVSLIA